MKYKILTLIGLAGSTVASLFGGWDMALQTLVIFMAIDWFTGGILPPGVFRKIPKSPGCGLPGAALVCHIPVLAGGKDFRDRYCPEAFPYGQKKLYGL